MIKSDVYHGNAEFSFDCIFLRHGPQPNMVGLCELSWPIIRREWGPYGLSVPHVSANS